MYISACVFMHMYGIHHLIVTYDVLIETIAKELLMPKSAYLAFTKNKHARKSFSLADHRLKDSHNLMQTLVIKDTRFGMK